MVFLCWHKNRNNHKKRFFKIRWGGVRYMNYRIVYYVGTNLICWIILDIIYRNFKKYLPKETLARTEVLYMIFWAMVACAADIVAGVFRGYVFAGSRALLITANLCYLVALVLVAFFWAEFAQKRAWFVPKWTILHRVLRLGPLVLFLVCAVMTPVSELLFTIDADGIYHRGPGWVFHTGALVYYLVYATVVVLYQCSLEPLQIKRRQYYPLLLFFLAPTTAGVLQVLIYGLSCFQAGVTIGIVMICMANQNYVMSTDALTGVYNRQALGNLLHDLYKQTGGCRLDVFMVDINDFKIINDKHGHMVGDQLLKQTASILDEICHELVDKPFLCRYGGDEFLMLLRDSSESAAQLNAQLKNRFEEEIKKEDRMYMTVSIGCAEGICNDEAEFERLLKEADADMYTDKSAYKARKTVS